MVDFPKPHMKLITRRILRTIFLLAFLIITPLVSIYAAGYKLSWKKISIQKTGMIILDSNPSGADIFINGKAQQLGFKKIFSSLIGQTEAGGIKTPAKIKNLLPGEYDVRIELPGYYPWQKRLKVEPGASTFAEDINLFRNDLPLQLISGHIDAVVGSDHGYLNAITSSSSLFISDENTNDSVFDTKIKTLAGSSFSWSFDSNFFIHDRQIYRLAALEQGNSAPEIDLAKIWGKNSIGSILWSPRDFSIFYTISKDNIPEIHHLDLNDMKDALVIRDKNIVSSAVTAQYLLAITRSHKMTLDIYSLSDLQLLRSLEIPESQNYHIINKNNDLINLLDADKSRLYLIEPEATIYSPLRDTIENIKTAHWVMDERLLCANDFEIWIYDIASKRQTLLTRISDKINQVIWHPSNNYVIYSTDRALNSIELDERNHRNITEIIRLDQISSPSLNQEGDRIFFSGRIGRQEGYYKLNLQ